jgi:ankyrin repeat protein
MGAESSAMKTTSSIGLIEPVSIRACVLCCTNRKDLVDETIQSKQPPIRPGLSSQHHPFLDAAAYGDIEDVKTQLLVDANLAKTVRDTKGNCAAHVAAFYGHLQVIQFLVETEPDILWVTNEVKNTPAHKAAESGKLTILAYLRDRDMALLSSKGAMGASPLHVAAAKVQ